METPGFEEVIIRFENVAQAITAEQELAVAGFSVRVMPTPPEIGPGCGFCLRFSPEDAGKAAAFLSGRGLEVKETYLRRPGGVFKKIS